MSLTVAAVAAATTLLAAQNGAPQSKPAASQQTAQQTAPVTIAGCVERSVLPGARTGAPPAYKLIDTQPGPAPTPAGKPVKTPLALEPQYWLQAPASIDLGKFQNQRVEVTGTISTPVAALPPDAPKDTPKSTLVLTTLRMISEECKG
jgi:hypothetical protein